MNPAPRFAQLHRSLSEPLRSLLLKDTTFELTGAWKFFARLEPSQTLLLYMPGYSALALSLARHVARVDVIGPNAEEEALLAEIAAAKALTSLNVKHSLAELCTPYGTIVLLPQHAAPEDALLLELLAHLAQQSGAEEWWVVAREVPRLKLTRRGRNFWQRLRTRQATRAMSSDLRLLFAPSATVKVAQLPEVLDGRLPAFQHELQLVPDFSSPKYVAPPFAWKKQSGVFENLRAQKPTPAEHTLLGFSNTRARSFLERLLGHLNRNRTEAWQIGRQYRVLPGGKVQIELLAENAPTAALLKLPLIPHAAGRMRENANHLVRLAQTEELREEQRRLFPQSLAEGIFEGQAFYLETFLSGRALEQLPAEQRSPLLFENVFAFWLDVQKRMARTVKITELVFGSVFTNLAERMQTWLKLEAQERELLQRVVAYWQERFAGRELGLGIVHGDFSIKNILVDPGAQRLTGVIDWDLADFFSVPLLDVLHFFVRLDARSFQEAPPMIALRLTQTPEGIHRGFFLRAVEVHGYHPEDWPGLVMLYWLFRMRGYLGSPKQTDAKFRRRQISEVLALFAREILSPRVGVVV